MGNEVALYRNLLSRTPPLSDVLHKAWNLTRASCRALGSRLWSVYSHIEVYTLSKLNCVKQHSRPYVVGYRRESVWTSEASLHGTAPANEVSLGRAPRTVEVKAAGLRLDQCWWVDEKTQTQTDPGSQSLKTKT